MIKMEIFKFFRHFYKIYRKRERYKVDKIEERAEPWPTLMFMLKIDDEKLFHW